MEQVLVGFFTPSKFNVTVFFHQRTFGVCGHSLNRAPLLIGTATTPIPGILLSPRTHTLREGAGGPPGPGSCRSE